MGKLTTCKDCGKRVSRRATACPACGAPLARATTTERTAKRYKLRAVVGKLLFIVGGITLGAVYIEHGALVGDAVAWGAGMVAVGAIAMLSARLGIWWHHT